MTFNFKKVREVLASGKASKTKSEALETFDHIEAHYQYLLERVKCRFSGCDTVEDLASEMTLRDLSLLCFLFREFFAFYEADEKISGLMTLNDQWAQFEVDGPQIDIYLNRSVQF